MFSEVKGDYMSRKITIIGAGSVGSTIAYSLSQEELASEIVMIDINKDKGHLFQRVHIYHSG